MQIDNGYQRYYVVIILNSVSKLSSLPIKLLKV